MFSPATEKALDSANKWDDYIDRMVMFFKEGYGLEVGEKTKYTNLKVRGKIEIYVPQNDEEFNRMINDAVFAKTLSRETGSEINVLGVNGEYDRIKKEVAADNAAAGSLDIN